MIARAGDTRAVARRKGDGPVERHHLLIIMAMPRTAVPHHLDPGLSHGDKGDGHAMAKRNRPTDYEREQQREIDEDSMRAGGRKKRKKGGKVKGLTAHHRMDRHHRRQVGGIAPGVPGALGAGLPPGAAAGAGALGAQIPPGLGGVGAGLPPGLAGAGARVPPGLAGVGAALPPGLGGIGAQMPRGLPAGAAAMPPGGIPATGAGVRPLGMARGGKLPEALRERQYNGVTPPQNRSRGRRGGGYRDGGSLPEELREHQYNGVEPPQKRQAGGRAFRSTPAVPRVPRRLVGESFRPAGGGLGLGGGRNVGMGATLPTAPSPRMPGGARAPALLAAGTRPRGYRRGGRADDEQEEDLTGRMQRGGNADIEEFRHGAAFPRQRGAPRSGAEREMEARGYQRGGITKREVTPARRDRPSDAGGRGRARGSRFGEKWMGGLGDEATGRIDRSRGSPILEDDIPTIQRPPAGIDRPVPSAVPGYGPDDNVADDTGPAFSNRDFVARGGRLTAGERQKLPKSEFALPGKGKGPKGAGAGSYPIPDESHARNALARVSQHGSSSEKARVRAAVRRKFPGIAQSGD